MENPIAVELPTFKSPPLSEASCGCRFKPLNLFRIPHYGVFWSAIRKDYPKVEHAAPVATDLSDLLVDPLLQVPIPRIWYLDATESELIQLQPNRLHLNWRQRDTGKPYPRFETMATRFMNALETLVAMLQVEKLGPLEPIACELSYTNHLVHGEDWETPQDIVSMFKPIGLSLSPPKLLTSESLSWASLFPFPDATGKLKVSLAHGKRATDQREVYVFELTATGIGEDRTFSGLRRWLEVAHTLTVGSFMEMTDEKVQRDQWGRRDVG